MSIDEEKAHGGRFADERESGEPSFPGCLLDGEADVFRLRRLHVFAFFPCHPCSRCFVTASPLLAQNPGTTGRGDRGNVPRQEQNPNLPSRIPLSSFDEATAGEYYAAAQNTIIPVPRRRPSRPIKVSSSNIPHRNSHRRRSSASRNCTRAQEQSHARHSKPTRHW